MRRALALLALPVLLTAACSHVVVIDTDPSGAEVKVNGERLSGMTPVQYTETTGWEKVYDIEVSKPGYKTTRKQVKQTEWNIPVAGSVGVCSLLLGSPLSVVGAIPLVGLLWARQLPDRVVVTFDKPAGAPGTGEAPPPASYGY